MTREITKFLKDVNGIERYNFDAINDEGFPINIIISERGHKGKTYGFKDFIFRQHLTHPTDDLGECLFLRSLSTDIQKERKKFLNNVSPLIKQYKEEFELTPEGIKHNGRILFCFNSVSTDGSLRGTRSLVRHIMWDEYNDSIRYFRKDLVDKIANHISSATDDTMMDKEGYTPYKLWLMGNNRGLNHPLLIELGIDHIDDEVMRIYDDNGNPFILLLSPIYTKADIEKIENTFKNNWIYNMNKRLGTASHIYYNESSTDKLNFVHRYIELTEHDKLVDEIKKFLDPNQSEGRLALKYTFLWEGNYLNIYWIPPSMRSDLNTRYHVININLMINYFKRRGNHELDPLDYVSRDELGYLVYTSNKNEIGEGVNLLPNFFKQSLIDRNADCEISFENVATRQQFIALMTH